MKRMNRVKRFLPAALAAVLALSAGCGSNANKGSNGVEQIYVGYYEGAFLDSHWKSWEALYNAAHPNEKVELILEGDPAYGMALENTLMTGVTPDIITSPMTWRLFASKGWLEPLGDVYRSEFNSSMTMEEALNDEIADNLLFKNEYYAIPFSEYMTGIAVNKGFFDEHGWDLPKTMTDMLDIVDKINALPENHDADGGNDVYPFVWSGVNAQYYWNYIMNTWWANYGGISEISTFKQMESPEVYYTEARIKAVDALLTLIGGNGTPKNCAPGVIGLNLTDSQMMFAAGQAVMLPNASWLETEIASNMPEGFEMALIAPPTIEGSKESDNLYGHVDEWLIIPAAAQNKDAAKKFVSFIFSEEGLLDLFRTTNTTSAFKVDYSKAVSDDMTEWSRSVLALRSEKNIFYSEGSSPFIYSGLASFWQTKMVTQMVTEGQTAEQIVRYDYEQVQKDWSSWQKQI